VGGPITAPAETWTWVPFADAFCGDGSSTGIGVNLTQRSSRVLIYLEGGGACWDAFTCYTLQTAANFSTGFSASDFANLTTGLPTGSFFDRNDSTNPFKDYSYVFVPYCTGDIHAGNNVATYGAQQGHHVGFANMTAYLARLVPTFPTADRIILAGSSAGGFGALFNWYQTQQQFGAIRVDLIDDSGTLMPADVPAHGYEATQRASWNLAATTPAGCTGCATDYDAIIGFTAQAFPHQRAAFLSYTQDSVLPQFSGITATQFSAGLSEQETTLYDSYPNIHFFSKVASGHVLWTTPDLTQDTVTVRTFLDQMVTDDPNWASVGP
jgi:hypothetical protein